MMWQYMPNKPFPPQAVFAHGVIRAMITKDHLPIYIQAACPRAAKKIQTWWKQQEQEAGLITNEALYTALGNTRGSMWILQ